MRRYTLYILSVLFLSACSRKAEVPDRFTEADVPASIYPDYRDVVVPPNIAPLNFIVSDSSATSFVVQLQGGGQELLAAAAANGTVQMDTTRWRALLLASKGTEVSVSVYARHAEGWVRFKPHKFGVAEEPIDAFLSYRLIEPGYELYRQLGIYQRNLTTFDEVPVYENNREYNDADNHCVNCHNFRMGSTESMLFHVRANHGGTVIVQNGKAHKVQLKDSTIITSAVYPSWHPTENLVAFSTNKTGQAFHLFYPEAIEVMDERSDLLLYDVAKNEVSHIIRTADDLETFPCWSADGTRLYYCSAKMPRSRVSRADLAVIASYDSLFYDLWSVPFDTATYTFGQPRLEVDASSQGMSCSVPRVSPDGRYLLYTYGKYGQFHIWHKSADLWVKDLKSLSGEGVPLTAANSPDADSYHCWSSNGRWIVFSSRRDDGNFTRPYITYFSAQGHARKPFMLPQRDPEYNLLLLKSYNVPELTRSPVRVSIEEMNHVVRHTEAQVARFKN